MSDKILKLDQAQTLYSDLRERIDALPTDNDVVLKQEVDDAGISSKTYTTIKDITITTAIDENHTVPYAESANVTLTGKNKYRITFDGVEYILPCNSFFYYYETNTTKNEKGYGYIGKLSLYTTATAGVCDEIYDVPFCLIDDTNTFNGIQIYTTIAGQHTIKIEEITLTKTNLPNSLIWDDELIPIRKKYSPTTSYYGISIGNNSLENVRGTVAIGSANTVKNEFGVAIGLGNQVAGNHGFVEGEFNIVEGAAAHAEGSVNIASGTAAHAEGTFNTASGGGSHVEGGSNTASGMFCHAEGNRTTAGPNALAHAEGLTTTASGLASHTEGSSTIASGSYSHAEGNRTTASGSRSHAEGANTVARGSASHVEGNSTIAVASCSHVGGMFNIADSFDSWPEWVASTNYVIGDKVKVTTIENSETIITGYICKTSNNDNVFNADNWSKNFYMNYAHIIGNGTDDNARSNAYALDWEGNGHYMGDVYVGANADSTGGVKLVKETDYASTNDFGVIKNNNSSVNCLTINNGVATVQAAGNNDIKTGTSTSTPIVPAKQGNSVFYGLAKAAGDSTQAASSNAVGTYTDAAKTSIRAMLGATSNNVIAVQDTQPTDTDTKIWLPETAETPVQIPTMDDMNTALAGKVGDVQINGSSIISNGIANIPFATSSSAGVISGYGSTLFMSNGRLHVNSTSNMVQPIKQGIMESAFAPVSMGHAFTFYGLAKAAGDTTQAASNNAVGTYTADAKTAIQTMLDVPSKADVTVSDIQMNGTSVLNNGIANIPVASGNNFGVVKISGDYGLKIVSGEPQIKSTTSGLLKQGADNYRPVTAYFAKEATFHGLAQAAGDTTQSQSDNAIGTYTPQAKSAIQTMLGVENGVSFVETISSTTPTITGEPNVRYMCGEVSTISITPPNAGTIDVVFTSGTTAALLTVPSTVKWPVWFDATTLETNTIYEILITDGIYGSVMTWAV